MLCLVPLGETHWPVSCRRHGIKPPLFVSEAVTGRATCGLNNCAALQGPSQAAACRGTSMEAHASLADRRQQHQRGPVKQQPHHVSPTSGTSSPPCQAASCTTHLTFPASSTSRARALHARLHSEMMACQAASSAAGAICPTRSCRRLTPRRAIASSSDCRIYLTTKVSTCSQKTSRLNSALHRRPLQTCPAAGHAWPAHTATVHYYQQKKAKVCVIRRFATTASTCSCLAKMR